MSLIQYIRNAASRAISDVRALGLQGLAKIGFIMRKPPSITQMPNASALKSMVAEAAYYRAGRRGSAGGDALYDWLEAEKDILAHFDNP